MFLIHVFEQARRFAGCAAGCRPLQSPIFSVRVTVIFKCTLHHPAASLQRKTTCDQLQSRGSSDTHLWDRGFIRVFQPILAHPDYQTNTGRPSTRSHREGVNHADRINKVCRQSANPLYHFKPTSSQFGYDISSANIDMQNLLIISGKWNSDSRATVSHVRREERKSSCLICENNAPTNEFPKFVSPLTAPCLALF